MNVSLKYKILYWKLEESARNFYDAGKINFSEINSGVEELIDGAESCLTMIYDRSMLTDEQFYEMLLKFAYIYDWNGYDCSCVLGLAHNLEFIGEAVIKTTMHANIQNTEGHGRDFSWWNEEIGIDFRILYTKDFTVDYDHFYTIEEIKKLIDTKQIIIICEENRNLAWEKSNYKKEEYQEFDYAYDDYSMKYVFFNKNGKFYPYTLKYIRSIINEKTLLELFKDHLDHSRREIYGATHKSCWTGDHFKKVAEEYSQEFKNQGYAKRLKRLNKFSIEE